MASGSVSAAISSTHVSRRLWLVFGAAVAVVSMTCERLLGVAVAGGRAAGRQLRPPGGWRLNARLGTEKRPCGARTCKPIAPWGDGLLDVDPSPDRRRPFLLDVALSRADGVGGTWLATRDEDKPLELGHEHPVLVVDTRVHLDGAAIGL